MSKQSEAREKQGYRTDGPRCGTCYHLTSDSVPIKWMVEMNDKSVAAGHKPIYDLTLPSNQKEANVRCQVGKFAVKKNAYCNQWTDANE